MSRRTVLVAGAAGTVGSAVLDELRRHDVDVRALVRRHDAVPAEGDTVSWTVADLGDAAAVRRVFDDVDAAFYVSPHEDDEVALATTFAAECRRAGARLVFAGVHVSTRTPGSWLRHQAFRAVFAAYRPKLRIGALIEATARSTVLVVPTNFFDNDLTFVPDIRSGRFPTPLRRVNRVAVEDVALGCVRALLDPELPGGTYPVCGPRSMTGPESAASWAAALGRPVTYTGGDRRAWERVAALRLPPGRKGRDWRASFALLGRLSIPTRRSDVDATSALIGRRPLDHTDWARRQVALLGADPTPATGVMA